MENLSATARVLGSAAPTIGGSMFDITAIPGFDVVQKLFLKLGMDTSLLVTLGMSLTLLTSLFSFFTYSISSLTTLTRFISANLVSSATIHSSDVTYLYVMRWLAVNRISTDCRLFCVTSKKNPMSHAVRRYSSYGPFGDGAGRNEDDDDEEVDGDEGGGCAEEDRLGPKLKYTPAPGFLHFWYKRNLIIINRKLDLSYYTGDIPDETMVLTTIGRSPTLLRELLVEARKEYLQAQSRKTMVYTLSPTPFAQKNWDQGRHRPSRDISTVIMPQGSKSHLLRDVKEYLNPVTARWYAQRGLPYRRGYLFYGPPGTGKTSLSLALAGELKVPLYILSLSTGSLTDETLTMLFVGLPRKCIVLLEDIDCAGVQRTSRHDLVEKSDWDSSDDEEANSGDESRTSKSKSKDKKKSSRSGGDNSLPPSPPRQPRMSVSFSGLLNAIDGVASHEGRILIMTTNHRERLDPALIRPGRVDMQIEFGYACKATLAEIFRELYSSVDGIDSATVEEEEEVFGGEDEPLLSPTEKSSEAREEQYRSTIHQLSEKFADMIPENKFTPAEIQGFLMSYKRAPRFALEQLPAWLKGKLAAESDSKGSRGARFKGDKKKAARNVTKPNEVEEKGQLSVTINSVPSVTPPRHVGFQGVVSEGGGLQIDKQNFDVEVMTKEFFAQLLRATVKQNISDGKDITKTSTTNPMAVEKPQIGDATGGATKSPPTPEDKKKDGSKSKGLVSGVANGVANGAANGVVNGEVPRVE
ncbi:P-loop containing nucleoside triphosphate hydrolase protein [Choiromyces venosus 120613-1]|uniref:P-loop containing nucleoside triphosphate hydrolase protein n=1 Tax=Choiromyces venosus 120613-1 TaxID=1336337 RepID=A0A3N4JU59_9PEZI|nr:P-loop containing nucleoside triphosphate hydrolase protein [Choiromyces venosus 120613-1]